jgi:membrane protein implicated in regulation of membrane protease activity
VDWSAWLSPVTYWHWWVLGIAFVVLEIFSPGVFLLWLGIAAGAVGLVMLALPELAWTWQMLLFALLSLASIALGRAYFRRHPIASDQPNLNRRGQQYVGRVFTLDAPMVNGVGKIRVDDSTWKIHGADRPAGARIRVVGVDGVILQVEDVGKAP